MLSQELGQLDMSDEKLQQMLEHGLGVADALAEHAPPPPSGVSTYNFYLIRYPPKWREYEFVFKLLTSAALSVKARLHVSLYIIRFLCTIMLKPKR